MIGCGIVPCDCSSDAAGCGVLEDDPECPHVDDEDEALRLEPKPAEEGVVQPTLLPRTKSLKKHGSSHLVHSPSKRKVSHKLSHPKAGRGASAKHLHADDGDEAKDERREASTSKAAAPTLTPQTEIEKIADKPPLATAPRRAFFEIGRRVGSERLTKPIKGLVLAAGLKNLKPRRPPDDLPWSHLCSAKDLDDSKAENHFAVQLQRLTEPELVIEEADGSPMLVFFASHNAARAVQIIFQHCPSQAVKVYMAKYKNHGGVCALDLALNWKRKGYGSMLSIFKQNKVGHAV